MEGSKTPRSFIQGNPSENISFGERTNNNSFKNLYTNLTLYLIKKLPEDTNYSDLEIVFVCYHKFLNIEKQKFTFLVISDDEIIKLKINNPRKEVGLGNLS